MKCAVSQPFNSESFKNALDTALLAQDEFSPQLGPTNITTNVHGVPQIDEVYYPIYVRAKNASIPSALARLRLVIKAMRNVSLTFPELGIWLHHPLSGWVFDVKVGYYPMGTDIVPIFTYRRLIRSMAPASISAGIIVSKVLLCVMAMIEVYRFLTSLVSVCYSWRSFCSMGYRLCIVVCWLASAIGLLFVKPFSDLDVAGYDTDANFMILSSWLSEWFWPGMAYSSSIPFCLLLAVFNVVVEFLERSTFHDGIGVLANTVSSVYVDLVDVMVLGLLICWFISASAFLLLGIISPVAADFATPFMSFFSILQVSIGAIDPGFLAHQGRGWHEVDGTATNLTWMRIVLPVVVVAIIGILLFNIIIAVTIEGFEVAKGEQAKKSQTFLRSSLEHLKLELRNLRRLCSSSPLEADTMERFCYLLYDGLPTRLAFHRRLEVPDCLAQKVARREGLQLGLLVTEADLVEICERESLTIDVSKTMRLYGRSLESREEERQQSASHVGSHATRAMAQVLYPCIGGVTDDLETRFKTLKGDFEVLDAKVEGIQASIDKLIALQNKVIARLPPHE